MVIDVNNPFVESLTAIVAGSIVSLLNRFVFSNPSCTVVQYCETIEQDEEESDTSNGSTMAGSVVVNNSSHVPHTHVPHISH